MRVVIAEIYLEIIVPFSHNFCRNSEGHTDKLLMAHYLKYLVYYFLLNDVAVPEIVLLANDLFS